MPLPPGADGPQAPPPATTEPPARVIRLLSERLELVEDLWQTVLRSECPPERVERLLRLKQLSGPVTASLEPESDPGVDTAGIVQLIREMDLADGIAAARAFYFIFNWSISSNNISRKTAISTASETHPLYSAAIRSYPPSPAKAIQPPSANYSNGSVP
jgi:hypothetical protein